MEQILKVISKAISAATFPLLMPTYALILSFFTTYLRLIPGSSSWRVIAVIFIITAMPPVIAIYILNSRKLITDPMLNNRRDRTWPFIIESICYLAATFYLIKIHAPLWMSMFMSAACLLVIILLVINMKWKISGHMTGMGGLTALSFFLSRYGISLCDPLLFPIIFILLSGLVGTSRLILGRHSLLQVAAGFILGFSIIYTSLYILNSF